MRSGISLKWTPGDRLKGLVLFKRRHQRADTYEEEQETSPPANPWSVKAAPPDILAKRYVMYIALLDFPFSSTAFITSTLFARGNDLWIFEAAAMLTRLMKDRMAAHLCRTKL